MPSLRHTSAMGWSRAISTSAWRHEGDLFELMYFGVFLCRNHKVPGDLSKAASIDPGRTCRLIQGGIVGAHA